MKTPTVWRSSNAATTSTAYSSSSITYNSPVTRFSFATVGISTISKQPTTWIPNAKTPLKWTNPVTKTPGTWTPTNKTAVKWTTPTTKTPVKWTAN